MTDSHSTATPRILVAIDVAKAKHDVLVEPLVMVLTGSGCNCVVMTRPTNFAVFRATKAPRTSFDLRSTKLTMAAWWLRPMMVSASQSPRRALRSTILGRSAIERRLGSCPRRA